jgi:hypothetical protein
MISAKARDLDIDCDPSLPAWRTAGAFTALEKMDPKQLKHTYPINERINREVKGKSPIFFHSNTEHNQTQNISIASGRVLAAPEWQQAL